MKSFNHLNYLQVVPDKWLTEFVDVCKKKNYMDAVSFIKRFRYEAYSASQVKLICQSMHVCHLCSFYYP